MPIDRSKLAGRPPRGQPHRAERPGIISDEARDKLLALPGVRGLGTGPGGSLVVFVADADTQASLPAAVEGHAVLARLTGSVQAY